MSQSTCHHVLASGALCQATPLRNRDYCRFHLQQIGRRMKAARSRARHQSPRLKLPLLEDLYSVQVAFMQLADAITYQEIEPQYARLLTTVLRLAMQNLKSKQAWERSSRFQLAANTENAVTDWDAFEQEHDLPTDLDLGLDPEVAFPPPPEQEKEGAGTGAPGSAIGWPNLGEGAPYIPGVGMGGKDAHDDPLRAKLGQLLRDAETPIPGSPVHVTADDVEIIDVYEREGEQAMMKCIAEQQRNRTRRERRARRLQYEEKARNHNIQLAAKKLVADQQKLDQQVKDQQRNAAAGSSTAQPQSEDNGEVLAKDLTQNSAEDNRKPPQREAFSRSRKTVAGKA